MAIISKGRNQHCTIWHLWGKIPRKLELMMKQLKQVSYTAAGKRDEQKSPSTEGNIGELGLVTLWALQLLGALGSIRLCSAKVASETSSWTSFLLSQILRVLSAHLLQMPMLPLSSAIQGPHRQLEVFLHCPPYCQVPQCKYCALVFQCQGSRKSVKWNQAHSKKPLLQYYFVFNFPIYHRPKTMGK